MGQRKFVKRGVKRLGLKPRLKLVLIELLVGRARGQSSRLIDLKRVALAHFIDLAAGAIIRVCGGGVRVCVVCVGRGSGVSGGVYMGVAGDVLTEQTNVFDVAGVLFRTTSEHQDK